MPLLFLGLCFLSDELNIPARQNGKLVTSEHTNPAGWPRGTEQNPIKTALAVFDVGIAKLHLNQKHCADLVTSEQPSPLGWLAWNRASVSVCHPERSRRGIMLHLGLQ